jgi:adenosylhomocysteine nucleosidase
MSKVLYNMNKKDILIVCALEMETQGQLNDYNVIYTGVGKVNAAISLTENITPRRPIKRVINFGTAGSRSLPIGELVECTQFVQRDMDKTALGFKKGETAFEDNVPMVIGCEHGMVCGTGDNFVQDINKELDIIDVFDMEAYALAKVCRRYNIPFTSYKYITDNANEKSAKDWESNLADGVIKFKEVLKNKL